MKPVLLLIVVLLGVSDAIAQVPADTTHAKKAAAVPSQATDIINLLEKRLAPTQQQSSQIGSLVTEYAGKFSESARKNASQTTNSVKIQAQQALYNQFSSSLSKLLRPEQVGKFNAVKSQVSALFAAIK